MHRSLEQWLPCALHCEELVSPATPRNLQIKQQSSGQWKQKKKKKKTDRTSLQEHDCKKQSGANDIKQSNALLANQTYTE